MNLKQVKPSVVLAYKRTIYTLRIISPKEKKIFLALALMFCVGLYGSVKYVAGKFLTDIPANGGAYSEGVLGIPGFINPILANSDADYDLVNLIYSGLLRSDNKKGLIPDLAEKYEISEDGLIYTFTLKNNLLWHDGKPLTADDIVFTVHLAQNQSIGSLKTGSWYGVNVEKIDNLVVRFSLKKPYVQFLNNLTMGILPQHIWKNVPEELFLRSDFNIKPIGSGPYKVSRVNKSSGGTISSYELTANNNFSLGRPFIDKITLYFYLSEKERISAYQKGEIHGISAVSPAQAEQLKRGDNEVRGLLFPRIFAVFFNQNNAKIFSQKEVRQALGMAVDKDKILTEVLRGFGVKINYPIPPETFGALTAGESKDSEFSPEKAKKILADAGWTIDKDKQVLQKKINKKETMDLEFSFATASVPDLTQAGELLKTMWENIGVKVNFNSYEVNTLRAGVIRPRKYEALLFGEIVGENPDPFAYWHSSQKDDPGYNLALYTNVTVDKLLQDARTTFDENKREQKYRDFQKEVEKDYAAIFLYAPRFIYITPQTLKSINEIESIGVPSDRFSQVYKWYMRTNKTWKFFAR